MKRRTIIQIIILLLQIILQSIGAITHNFILVIVVAIVAIIVLLSLGILSLTKTKIGNWLNK